MPTRFITAEQIIFRQTIARMLLTASTVTNASGTSTASLLRHLLYHDCEGISTRLKRMILGQVRNR
jgi:hypothetical protein